MLKTGLKSFVYSFSVSLFAIVSTNKVVFYEKNQNSSSLDIQNKSIALYLADTNPSYLPVKKIALNSLPKIQKQQEMTPPLSDPEIIVASTLEPLDIPLEFVESVENTSSSDPIFKNQEIKLADVLYAPDKPLSMPEIKAEPIYQPETNLEIKIASAPVYNPKTEPVSDIKAPPPPPSVSKPSVKAEVVETKKTDMVKKEDNSLLIARSETVKNIPLQKTHSNNGINKVQIGDPKDLQHIAFANTNASIQSMSEEKNIVKEEKEIAKTKEWKQLNDSPWVVAKSSGSKNLFVKEKYANKTDKEIADLIPLEKDKKGVLVASETTKNLIIPIPEEILKKDNITPQLAYPLSSEDKKKEIDINAKIKEAEEKEKAKEASQKAEKPAVLTPVEDEADITTPKTPPANEEKPEAETTEAIPTDMQPSGFMNKISSIFNKTAQSVSDATDAVIEKAKAQKNALSKKRSKNKNKNKELGIMPTEMRLAFQPNRAEISGQTLRWIQAFASKTAQTPGMMLELRIDGTSSTKLQQKRLNLLYNILTNKGVDYSMINTVFTSRDPNSFILRTVASENNKNKQGVNNQKTDRYIQW